ncbi:MAG: type II secretion system protein N [Gammaproteobacteria bacterium]
MKRLPLLFSVLAVVALSASIAYWAMQLYKPPQRPLAVSAPVSVPEPSADAAATLFGGQAVAVVATNYQLTGVVAAGREGVAILVAEGQPPKAVRVGKEIGPGVQVVEVAPRYVMLSEGGMLKRIELATDAKAGPNLAPPLPDAQAGNAGFPQPQNPMPAPTPMPNTPPPAPPPVPEPLQPQMPAPQMPQPQGGGSEQPQGSPVQPLPPHMQTPTPGRGFSPNGVPPAGR